VDCWEITHFSADVASDHARHFEIKDDMSRTDWETVARCIFKDNEWLDMVNKSFGRPFFLGCHLNDLVQTNFRKPKFIALGDSCDDNTIHNTREQFFQSLRPNYRYVAGKELVFFTDCKLCICIAALTNRQRVVVPGLHLLFNEGTNGPMTNIMFCDKGIGPSELTAGSLGGLCKEQPLSIKHVSLVCSLKISLVDGKPLYQEFYAPECPNTKGIPYFDENNKSIGHGRFEIGTLGRVAVLPI
jgi:hypothetical protein